jgi:hypothetical protein
LTSGIERDSLKNEMRLAARWAIHRRAMQGPNARCSVSTVFERTVDGVIVTVVAQERVNAEYKHLVLEAPDPAPWAGAGQFLEFIEFRVAVHHRTDIGARAGRSGRP